MPNGNTGPDSNPYLGTEWWQEGMSEYSFPSVEETLNWGPSGDGDALQEFKTWLDEEWHLTNAGAASVASYLMGNPYNPADEMEAINRYNVEMGTISSGQGVDKYKAFTDNQNRLAQKGYQGSSSYTQDVADKFAKDQWKTNAYAQRQGMESSISDAHDEFMASWWDILLEQPGDIWDFYVEPAIAMHDENNSGGIDSYEELESYLLLNTGFSSLDEMNSTDYLNIMQNAMAGNEVHFSGEMMDYMSDMSSGNVGMDDVDDLYDDAWDYEGGDYQEGWS